MPRNDPERLLSLDIETVPDADLSPRRQGGDGYAKAHMHRVVAISFVEARIERGHGSEAFIIEDCRSGGELGYDERRLLAAFWRYIVTKAPRLVTWNGRGHDLAVLRLRAMMYGLDVSCWTDRRQGAGYQFRYSSTWHCDLADQLSDYGAALKLSLQQASDAFGFPGKLVSGPGTVETLFKAGQLAQIREYCEIDAVNTFGVYLKWAGAMGLSSPQDCERGLEGLRHFLEGRRSSAPLLGRFLDRWRAGRPAPSIEPAHPEPVSPTPKLPPPFRPRPMPARSQSASVLVPPPPDKRRTS